jgi:DNA modification methylase
MSSLLMLGDCLERMKEIESASVDLILTDPPYGTTSCKWDSVIDLTLMWEQLKRIIKPNGAIVMTAANPFTSVLVTSNLKMFRYSLVWDKVNKNTGFANANKMPMRRHEDVVVFYNKLPTYNKQMRVGEPYKSKVSGAGEYMGANGLTNGRNVVNDGTRNPCSIIAIKGDNKKECGMHPTQKPIELMEYFVKTYTNEGETVLDFTMGSGTTGVACINTSRKFIGIEMDKKYFAIASERINNTK